MFLFNDVFGAVGALSILTVVYTVFQGIWRLYFSPISKFPGPKLAALTYWYMIAPLLSHETSSTLDRPIYP